MSRLEETFHRLKDRGEAAFIAYIAGGDPKPEYTPRIVEAMVKGGADIIELGIPFSDPIADGPTIQAANVRALESGVTPKIVLETVRRIKSRIDVPVVILTYYNPVFRMGLKDFFGLAKNCGVDGLAVPDLPVEEAEEYKNTADVYGVDTVFFAAPSTSAGRLKKIIDYASGFLYLISIFGITGVRERILDLTTSMIRKNLPYTEGRVPLAVGFGISKPDHVKTIVDNKADGVIAGSVLVRIVEKNLENMDKMIREIEEKTRELKKATVRRF